MTNYTSKVFIHGFLGSPKDWQEIVKDKNAIYLNLWEILSKLKRPNHGFKDFSQYFLDLCPEGAEVYSYSLGARLCLFTACHYPNHFRKLSFFSVNPGLKTKEQKNDRLKKDKQWIEKLEKLSWNEFCQKWQKQKIFEHDPKKEIPPIPKDLVAKALDYWSVAKQENLWDDLSKLPTNSHFICGKKDTKFLSITNEIAQHGYNKYILKECGHRVPFTCKEVGPWHWEKK